jgi:hypothetical protein
MMVVVSVKTEFESVSTFGKMLLLELVVGVVSYTQDTIWVLREDEWKSMMNP